MHNDKDQGLLFLQKSSDVAWNQYWTPKLYVENNIGEIKSKINFGLKYDASGKATIVESRQLSGTFFEFMELNKFPFDSQVDLRFRYLYL